MMILFYLIIGFLGIRLIVVWVNVLTRPVLGRKEAGIDLGDQPDKVSILIPARNEEENLPRLFDQISQLKYEPLEVIVLDDQSEDQTAEIIRQAAERDARIRMISGQPLPRGWLGKNRACHLLAEQARGDYFLFLDADIAVLGPDIIKVALGEIKARHLSLLSVFPDQIMLSWGERLVVPLMHYILLSLLPLWAIYRFRFPSLAAANGQFMLFDANTYRHYKWHEKVKNIIVEDIAIMQEIKRAGLKGMTFVAGGWISCRMYRSFYEGLAGFSKNILAGFGNQVIGLIFYLMMIWFFWGVVIWFISWPWLLTGLVLILGIRLGISLLARQKISLNLLLHPVQMICLIIIGIWSVYRKYSGKNEWKGRTIA